MVDTIAFSIFVSKRSSMKDTEKESWFIEQTPMNENFSRAPLSNDALYKLFSETLSMLQQRSFVWRLCTKIPTNWILKKLMNCIYNCRS